MIKKILILFFTLSVIVYLTLSVTILNTQDKTLKCSDIELAIKDSIHGGFITQEEIYKTLKSNKLYPVDKYLNDISTRDIKDMLQKHPLISKVDCFKTIKGTIAIQVYQRIPVFRVLSNSEAFFVDRERQIMPTRSTIHAYLPVVSGNVSKEFAQKDMYDFILYISKHSFWNNQIEQIYVGKEDEIELIPRVGDHVIYIGSLEDYKHKLNRVSEFYDKVLSKVGWNKYNKINVEFNNQIICTRVNI